MQKGIGIVLIVIGCLLVIPAMISFIKIVNEFIFTVKVNNAYQWGHFMGGATIGIFEIVLTFILLKYGIRSVRKPVKKEDESNSTEDSFHSNTNP